MKAWSLFQRSRRELGAVQQSTQLTTCIYRIVCCVKDFDGLRPGRQKSAERSVNQGKYRPINLSLEAGERFRESFPLSILAASKQAAAPATSTKHRRLLLLLLLLLPLSTAADRCFILDELSDNFHPVQFVVSCHQGEIELGRRGRKSDKGRE